MDIPKAFANLNNKPAEKFQALQGTFYNSSFQERHTIPFSCTVEDYYRVISPHIIITNYGVFSKFIYDFISSCLMLGCFLKDVGMYDPNDFICATESSWHNFTGENIREKVRVRIRTLENETVEIYMTENRGNFRGSYVEITHNNAIAAHRLLAYGERFYPNVILKNNSQTYQIDITFKQYILPKYKDLPLYINVPYMRTYARDMFEKPPPPPPQLVIKKPKIYWI